MASGDLPGSAKMEELWASGLSTSTIALAFVPCITHGSGRQALLSRRAQLHLIAGKAPLRIFKPRSRLQKVCGAPGRQTRSR